MNPSSTGESSTAKKIYRIPGRVDAVVLVTLAENENEAGELES